ncbi:prepilin-type N-terminal cleavage/methylation domain-containing protein [Bacillus benzoevorans]|uniref:Prepilin-type N-terminal cleavage/methylation domain-containing protein n=1 Tax=Bacillus benzoevorans TaxID=1456 RepID=A0A7X0LVT5_9BACI|nr:prepilin-type N-terminal cleavage/methylation domain-containing protein [Bacillus benzoevorans]MBB6445855.1 prepilin-type N-terminal cleavage/methylation domain-containing protein [Bacillus benzoevorans]
MKKFIENIKGITLIELLISLSILSIVLISLFAFFTNTFRFNSLNSDDIQAMNVAREYKELIKKDYALTDEIDNWSKNPNKELIMEPKNNDTHYDVIISISAAEETAAVFPIYLVHIEVRKENELLSETYTYYEPADKETSAE